MNNKKIVAIIGGGPAALMLAASLDIRKYKVTIYEKNKALGRKFLVAGKGGFNLTHSESIDTFIDRYTPNDFLKNALSEFTNQSLIQWLEKIGIPTFVGSSKRIYPVKGIKPIEVLKKIMLVLEKKQVKIIYNKEWLGWNEKEDLVFEDGEIVEADYKVFAMGGGSWNVTGSDGTWLERFSEKGILTKPFVAANCAYKIDWPTAFLEKNEGKPLKNLVVLCDEKKQKGEAVITQFGLEGNAIYALSPQIQEQLDSKNEAVIYLDLKPPFSEEEIKNKLQSSKEKNISNTLRNVLKMNAVQIDLLKVYLSKEEFLNIEILVHKIKNLALKIQSAAAIDEAISTTGGVALEAVDKHFQIKKMKSNFCIGEMLDWNAPTGGYLLQACFSMGFYVAKYLNQK